MPVQKTFAVILARHANSTAPTLDDCRTLMTVGPGSLARYWQENSAGWFQIKADYFGPYGIRIPPRDELPTGQAQRRAVYAIARDTALERGAQLRGYDGVIVLLAPGDDYDAGAVGGGALLPVGADHTFYCHEVGHMLGFGHTYGIPTPGADFNERNLPHPVYGDPYDLMSSARFGNADPQTTSAIAAAVPGFPTSRTAGPMLSRAHLHHHAPDALEQSGKAAHVREGEGRTVVLTPAGRGAGVELVVYHPNDEDAQHRGRVYVELRQPAATGASRWDQGLAVSGAERDRRGLVIHTVRDVPDRPDPAVWYAGRVVFPNPDADVEVSTPKGQVVVHVDEKAIAQDAPVSVRVWFKSSRSAPRVRIIEDSEPRHTVIRTEKRAIPGWDFAGLFTWEIRETILTSIYRPVIQGLGGSSPRDEVSSLTLRWYVGGQMLTADSGQRVLSGGQRLRYRVDGDHRVLTLTNNPADGSYETTVEFVADDGRSYSARTMYRVDGRSEGWGKDYHDYMAVWHRITNPIPERLGGPPRPDDYLDQLDRLWIDYGRLVEGNGDAAARVRPWVVAHDQRLRRSRDHRGPTR